MFSKFILISSLARTSKAARTLTSGEIQVLPELIAGYGSMRPIPLSQADFIHFSNSSTLEKNLNFLRTEIPVRLANIVAEKIHLPKALQREVTFHKIMSEHEMSIVEAVRLSQTDLSGEGARIRYCDAVTRIRRRHLDSVEDMARAVTIYRRESGSSRIRCSSFDRRHDEWRLQYFLERFFMGGIGLRMLTNQSTVVFGGKMHSKFGLEGEFGQLVPSGRIDPELDLRRAVTMAVFNARATFERENRRCPRTKMMVWDDVAGHEVANITACAVDSHVAYVVSEIVINAMRATVEAASSSASSSTNSDHLPDVEVLIARTRSNGVVIRVTDSGGGIELENIAHLSHFNYSTKLRTTGKSEVGYGIPMARLYARYFKGDLVYTSVLGEGTVATYFLRSSSFNESELLPIYNSVANMGSAEEWSDATVSFDTPIGSGGDQIWKEEEIEKDDK